MLETYRQAGIEAVAFGELFEIRAGANREKTEQMLGPLKHTIFVGQRLSAVAQERSFYVVPVREFYKGGFFGRPEKNHRLDEYLQAVPEVRDRYSAEFIAGVRHWLAQVVLSGEKLQLRGKLVLYQGILWDAFGAQGPVAPGEAIGVSALEMARQRARAALEQAQEQLQEAQARLIRLRTDLQEERQRYARRLEVDRELPETEKVLAVVNQELKRVTEKLALVEQEIRSTNTLMRQQEKELDSKAQLLKQVDGELAVYAEYEREADSISRIRELKRLIDEKNAQKEAEQRQCDALYERTEALGREIREARAELNDLKDRLNAVNGDLERKETEKNKVWERAETLNLEAEDYQGKLTDLQDRYANVVKQITRHGQWLEPEFAEREFNRDNLTRKVKEGEGNLQDVEARHVDEEAREKYEEYLYEFEAASKELEECHLRFEQLKKKEEEQRDRYDKAVYLRWQRTNRLFSTFMERLGMVGEIRSLPPEEDNRNAGYRWELHVSTKVGHRPEKVNPESGKIVGEGISGGERAAVSLVFALALLCDIQNRPPFYVLDEFDSALDEERKHEIFNLYKEMLQRKLLVISPKVHGDRYLDRFGKFHCVVANPGVQQGQSISEVYDVTRGEYVDLRLKQEV